MTPESFRQIEELYHAARQKTGAERAALLARADPVVRRQVESLLAQPPAGEFLDRPALQNADEPGDSTVTVVQTGASFGPYRVESKLGEGGMGEVFRAVDTRLGRPVAVKVLHEKFSDRFEREARAIAALNHPHICTLYDVGPNYLVMEFIEGETLSQRLRRDQLSMEETLRYGGQIADALAAAHAKGIIHRDLKPGNIMLAQSGVKVLDFGLAKSGTDETVTASGVVMGTPAYMSPEQRAGQPADARSDIYSFGCILYEMLTGTRVGHRRKRIPSRKLGGIVDRCLEEDAAQRWQSVGELERELSDLSSRKKAGMTGHAARPARPAPTGKLADKITIILADFTNATGDPAFDGALRQILEVQLENSPRLALLPDAAVSRTLGLMGRPNDGKLTPGVAAQVCERTGSAAVVEGSITGLGNEYVLSLRARDCRTGEILVGEQASAASKEHVFQVIGQMAKRFGARAGQGLPTEEKEPSLPTDVTTASQEAWRSYSAAMKTYQRKAQSPEAISLLKRAVETDPQFAMAYAFLGGAYFSLGESELATESIAKAYELRNRVGDQENFYVTFSYHRQVTRNLELARQTLESWTQKYPSDLFPRGFLSGLVSPGSGYYDKAVEEGLKALELDPDYSIGYVNVAWAYIYMNRASDAEALLRRASERRVEVFQLSLARYAISLLRGDREALEREITERRTKLQAQGFFEHQEAMTLAYHGRLKDAARLSDRATTLARQGGLLERVALFQGARAVWNALFGMGDEAHGSAASALSLCRTRDTDYGSAFALALLRDDAQVQNLVAGMEERYPQDTCVQFGYLPALRALEALNRGDPAKALEMTLATASYDLAIPATAYFTGGFFGALYPVYLRGLAYARLDRPRDAAAEFQRILDHPGLIVNDPIGPMARLQLARALRACGDRTRAAEVYRDLFAIWKDADPEPPVVQQATAERAEAMVGGAE